MEFIEGLETTPRAEVIWNDPDAGEKWGKKVSMARRLHNDLEYLMVLEGKRRCATIHLRPTSYDKMIEKITNDGLVWLPVKRSKAYSGFSHKHFPVEQLDMNSTVYGVLAANLDDAKEFKRASKTGDHEVIGNLLGFPECCSEFFNEIWPEFYDPLWQVAESSDYEEIGERHIKVKPHIATHQMLRYTGFRLTSHFPCSLDCEKSIEVGKDWMELAQKHYPKSLEAWKEVIQLPGKWSCLHGVAIVTTYPFTMLSNSMPTLKEWVIEWDEVLPYDS